MTNAPAADVSALEHYKPRLLALDAARLTTLRVDARAAAEMAVAAAERFDDPAARARLEKLSKDEFSPEHLASLRPLARALVEAQEGLEAARAARATAEVSLPAELVERATALKDRMLRVARYHLDGDPALAKTLAALGRKRAPADLGGDLVRLASLYREKAALLATDSHHYRAADADDAAQLAAELDARVNEQRRAGETTWSDLSTRALTLLAEAYEEVRAAEAYLWRREPRLQLLAKLALAPPPRLRARKTPKAADAPEPATPPAPADAPAPDAD